MEQIEYEYILVESEHETHEDHLTFHTRTVSFMYNFFSALFCVHVRFYARNQFCTLSGYPGTPTSRVPVSGKTGTRPWVRVIDKKKSRGTRLQRLLDGVQL